MPFEVLQQGQAHRQIRAARMHMAHLYARGVSSGWMGLFLFGLVFVVVFGWLGSTSFYVGCAFRQSLLRGGKRLQSAALKHTEWLWDFGFEIIPG